MDRIDESGAPEPGLSADARRDQILRHLNRDGFASVRALTARLGVSDMTVRRDLRKLEKKGALRVVHGGASLPRSEDYQRRGRSAQAAKTRIARHAVGLIPMGAAILLDAGTTVAEMALALPPTFEGYVISHSIPVINYLAETEIAMHCPGGELVTSSLALAGPTTVENLAKMHAELAFMGTASLSARGMFVAKDLERSTKQAVINAARTVILLADHTKFSIQAPVHLAALDVIDVLITDAEPPLALRRALDAASVEIHIVTD